MMVIVTKDVINIKMATRREQNFKTQKNLRSGLKGGFSRAGFFNKKEMRCDEKKGKGKWVKKSHYMLAVKVSFKRDLI